MDNEGDYARQNRERGSRRNSGLQGGGSTADDERHGQEVQKNDDDMEYGSNMDMEYGSEQARTDLTSALRLLRADIRFGTAPRTKATKQLVKLLKEIKTVRR